MSTNPTGYLMIALIVLAAILIIASIVIEYAVPFNEKAQITGTAIFWIGIALLVIWGILIAVYFITHRIK